MFVGQQHELLESGPPAVPSVYQATVFSTGAAIALVAWDTLLTLDDEADYIWSGSRRAHVKWIYLFSRWFGLLNQLGIQIWRCFLVACAPVPVSICKTFFIFEGVTFLSLQLCLNAILLLRIWAVYRRHRPYYITIAFAIVVFETLTSIVVQAISFSKSTVDGICILLHTPETTTCIGIGIIVSQSVLFSLIYRGKTLLQPAARRSKLITVVVRDGILVFGIVIGIVSIASIYYIFNQAILNVFIPWMPALPSILTPRMILNMQMAAAPTESMLEFTTNLGTVRDNEIRGSNMHELSIIYEHPTDSSRAHA